MNSASMIVDVLVIDAVVVIICGGGVVVSPTTGLATGAGKKGK